MSKNNINHDEAKTELEFIKMCIRLNCHSYCIRKISDRNGYNCVFFSCPLWLYRSMKNINPYNSDCRENIYIKTCESLYEQLNEQSK